MIKVDMTINKTGYVEISGNARDLAIEFSTLIENCIHNGLPARFFAGVILQACCQGKLSDDEFSQATEAVDEMLEALVDKYFDK